MGQAGPEGQDGLDADIFAGMLSAVQDFVKDSFDPVGQQSSGLGRLEYGDMKILIEHGQHIYLTVVFRGEEHLEMRKMLRQTIRNLEKHSQLLGTWTGNMNELEPLDREIKRLSRCRFLVRKNLEGINLANERTRIADEILENLKEHSSRSAILLILEDIHWADESSLLILEYLARNIASERIMILGTYRPNESQSLESIIMKLSQEEHFKLIPLMHLDAEAVSGIINELYENNDFSRTFVENIVSQTEGNPFFIQEMLHQMHLDESIVQDEGIFKLVSQDYSIPDSVEMLVGRRLDVLEPDSMSVAECASCAGRVFERNAVTSLDLVTEPGIALGKVESAGIVILDNGTGEFNHAIYQRVIYDSVGDRWKHAYHRQIGEYYENVYSENPDEIIYELARHFSKSNVHDKAFDYSIRAGEKAESSYSPELAIEHYNEALKALRILRDKDTELDILERLADLKAFVGDFKSAVDLYHEILKLAQDNGLRARIFRKKGHGHERMGEYENTLKCTLSGMEEIPKSKDPEMGRLILLLGLVKRLTGKNEESLELHDKSIDFFKEHGAFDRDLGIAYRAKGNTLRRIGRLDGALESFQTGLEHFSRVKDDTEMGTLLSNIGNVYCDLGRFDESLANYQQGMEIMERTRNNKGIAQVANNLGVLEKEKGNMEGAIQYYQLSIEMLKKMGLKNAYATVLNNIGNTYASKGEFHKTKEYFLQSLQLRETIGDKDGMAQSFNNLGLLNSDLGDFDEAWKYYEKSLALAKEIDDLSAIALCYLNMGENVKYNEKYTQAMELYQKSLDMFREIGDTRTVVNSLCGIAETYLELSELDKALESAKDALEAALAIDSKNQEQMARIALGTIYRRTGNYQEAEKELAKAKELFDITGEQDNLAKAKLEMGLLELDKDNREKALALVSEAHSMFEDTGMKYWASVCKKIMDES